MIIEYHDILGLDFGVDVRDVIVSDIRSSGFYYSQPFQRASLYIYLYLLYYICYIMLRYLVIVIVMLYTI